MEIKLEPCPFCGAENNLLEDGGVYGISCTACRRALTSFESQADAITQWNTLSLIMQEIAKDDEEISQWGKPLDDGTVPNAESALFCCKLQTTLTHVVYKKNEQKEQRIAELESTVSELLSLLGCQQGVFCKDCRIKGHCDQKQLAAYKKYSGEPETHQEKAQRISKEIDGMSAEEFRSFRAFLEGKFEEYQQSIDKQESNFPFPMGFDEGMAYMHGCRGTYQHVLEMLPSAPEEKPNKPKEDWHRVGDLEVAPFKFWKRMQWDNARTYCQSLKCFMPDRMQLSFILNSDITRSLFGKNKRIENQWFWSATSLDSEKAWVHRPFDSCQTHNDKFFDMWVIPCRKAEANNE